VRNYLERTMLGNLSPTGFSPSIMSRKRSLGRKGTAKENNGGTGRQEEPLP